MKKLILILVVLIVCCGCSKIITIKENKTPVFRRLYGYEQSLKKCPQTIICQQHTWGDESFFCSSYPEESPMTEVCSICYGHFGYIQLKDFNSKNTKIIPNNKKLGECNYEFNEIERSYGFIWWRGKKR